MTMSTKRYVQIAMLSAIALILSYIERMIPIPYPIPGLKLGLANVAVVLAMYVFGFKEGLFVSIIKSILSTMLFGSVTSLMYSLPASVTSSFVMGFVIFIINKKNRYFSSIGVSVFGSFFFNVTQVIVASFVISDKSMLKILPYMSLLSIFTGIFIGLTVKNVYKAVNKSEIRGEI